MAASSPVDGVRALAAPAAAAAGLVLENVTITPAGRRRVLRVVVDLPDDAVGGVPMEAVAQASQALSEALDSSDVMGGAPYVLEVSSPGADRPLTERRHWLRARGRLVRVALADGRTVKGRVVAATEGGVVLDRADTTPVAWADLRTGRIELEFGRPDVGEGDPVDGIDVDGIDVDGIDVDGIDVDGIDRPEDEMDTAQDDEEGGA
jgi:ribosome maturation factor RimP